jgi:flagellar basal-body rod protein FlgF
MEQASMEDGLLGIGAAMLSRSQRRLEVTTANVANMTTPGFKKQRVVETFAGTLAQLSGQSLPSTNFSQGVLKATTGKLDLGISGQGFFQVRDSQGDTYFSRSGQFSLGIGGRVIDGRGMILQTVEGRDLILSSSDVQIVENGTVVDNGRPIARIGLFTPASRALMSAFSGSLFRASGVEMVEVETPVIKQGKLEGSNVDMSFEMTEIMSAMRQAETGSRIVQTFDTLIGQSISTFGRSGK